MRAFFRLLYHSFAFAYDLVAAVVSFGQWNRWGAEIIPHIEGKRILELGHGPGHLQRELLTRNLNPVGLDESRQMSRLAQKRIGNAQRLARGTAQRLPFADDSFDSVIAAFPTEYIFDPRTLTSIQRVLQANGKLVILLATFPQNKFLKWLYKTTGENPFELSKPLQEKFRQPFIHQSFETQIQTLEVKSSVLLMIVATNKK